MPKKILITTGDPDGIGYEVSAKALAHLGPTRGSNFVIYSSADIDPRYRKKLGTKFKIVTVSSFAQIDFSTAKPNFLFEVVSSQPAPHWVQEAGKLCLAKQADALVTGPLSKELIAQSGFRAIGHTDILKRLSLSPHVFMGFVGKHFNVVLTTGHIPLEDVAKKLSPDLVERAVSQAEVLRAGLGKSARKLPLGILGLNPHSGDGGLIGQTESTWLAPLIRKIQSRGIEIEGPLVPDVAFQRSSWRKYSVFIALYHDQGLIPFKLAHGQDSGLQVSLGLPFLRTSVDHGTAKDIFGLNRANPGSMIDALSWALKNAKE